MWLKVVNYNSREIMAVHRLFFCCELFVSRLLSNDVKPLIMTVMNIIYYLHM